MGIAQMKFETGKQEYGLLDTLYISYFIWRVLFVSASVHNFELKFFKMDLKIKMEPNNYVIKYILVKCVDVLVSIIFYVNIRNIQIFILGHWYLLYNDI